MTLGTSWVPGHPGYHYGLAVRRHDGTLEADVLARGERIGVATGLTWRDIHAAADAMIRERTGEAS